MKIAINFGDNDFGNCFLGVLRTLNNAYNYTGYLPTDKDKLVKIINDLSPICYVLFQNDILSDKTKNYIQIKNTDLLIDDEVDEYAKLTHAHNSDTFVLDTDLNYKNNSPIYFL